MPSCHLKVESSSSHLQSHPVRGFHHVSLMADAHLRLPKIWEQKNAAQTATVFNILSSLRADPYIDVGGNVPGFNIQKPKTIILKPPGI